MPRHAPLFLQSPLVSLSEHYLNYKTSAKSAHLRERSSSGCHDNRDVTHPLTPRFLHNKADVSSVRMACMSMDAWMHNRHEKQALESCQYFHSRTIMKLETANCIQQSPSEANIRSVGQIIPHLLRNQKLDGCFHMRSSTANTRSWSTYIQCTATIVRYYLYEVAHNMKLLLICILRVPLLHSFILFRFYFYQYIYMWFYSCLIM
jgi:hypothetical protein